VTTSPIIETHAHYTLVERVSMGSSRAWMDNYFDLIGTIIEATGLKNNDPRLVTAIPMRATNWSFLPVTINNRYVLASTRDQADVAIICHADVEAFSTLYKSVAARFAQLSGERYEGQNPPILVWLNDCFALPTKLNYAWIRAVVREVQRAKASPYARYHQPLVYEAAVNLDYRAEVLIEAFGI
jgi:hypothetical protein